MGLAKQLIDKSIGSLNLKIKAEKFFFGIPTSLKSIKVAAAKSIESILKKQKRKIANLISSLSAQQIAEMGLELLVIDLSDDNITDYVKRNKDLRDINNHSKNRVNESIASEITSACFDPNFSSNRLDALETSLSKTPMDANNYLAETLSQSDFEEKTNSKSKYNAIEDLYAQTQTALPVLLLTYELFLKVKSYIINNRYPSKFRTVYLQGQIRELGLLLKKSIVGIKNQIKEEIEPIIKSISKIDALIIGISTAAFIYLRNRNKGQEVSTAELEAIVLENTCSAISPPLDASTTEKDIKDFSCPVPDSVIVPHKPLKIDINEFGCEVDIQSDVSISPKLADNLVSKAIIQNLSSSEGFEIYIHKDQFIEANTPLGKIGNSIIYSSVTGTVEKIEPNIIWLKEISDIGNNLFEQTTLDIKSLYEELNEIKRFTKDFYLNSWYPAMLSSTPFIDPSLNTIPTISKSGIKDLWKFFNDQANKTKAIFDKNIRKVTDQDNINTKAKNNKLVDIVEEFNKLEDLLYKNLNQYADAGIKAAKLTKVKKKDLIYFDYLISLISRLNNYDDQNKTIINFNKKLNEFLLERYFIEKKNLKDLISNINDNCEDLGGNRLFENKKDYYEILSDIFKDNTEKDQFKSVNDYLVELGKSRNKLNQSEEIILVSNTLEIFKFSRIILDIQNNNNEYKPSKNINKLSFEEGNFIKKYFGQIRISMTEIPKEILELEKKLDDLGISFVPPSIINIDDEDYEWYGIKAPSRDCPVPEEEDEYLTADTEYDISTIQYWLKYCSFATLASVANPIRGWSTGIPPPLGPIQLPVVYVPAKSFVTKWGFIVVGITICGLYPFPWVLFGNLSTNYNTPIGNPAALIKNKIKKLKENLSSQLKRFKQDVLGGYLKRQEIKVIKTNEKLDQLVIDDRNHRISKPVKDRSKNTNTDKLAYVNELGNWAITQAEYVKDINNTKNERFVEETKYKTVYDAFTGVGSIKDSGLGSSIKSMKKGEDALLESLDKLNKLVDEVDKVLIPLPITMKPNTVNFGITAKNPKPIIKIKENVAPEIKNDEVQKIIDKFALKSEDFMSNKFGDKATNGITGNFKKYKSALSLAKFALVSSDPFPKYENLNPGNISWLPFLYNSFVVTGAKTYGIPGFPPF